MKSGGDNVVRALLRTSYTTSCKRECATHQRDLSDADFQVKIFEPGLREAFGDDNSSDEGLQYTNRYTLKTVQLEDHCALCGSGNPVSTPSCGPSNYAIMVYVHEPVCRATRVLHRSHVLYICTDFRLTRSLPRRSSHLVI